MKSCMIFGDLTSEKSSDNYPTVQICDECVKEQQIRKKNSQIVFVGEFDCAFGDECEMCGKTLKDEQLD